VYASCSQFSSLEWSSIVLLRAQPVAMDSNQSFNGDFLKLAFQGRINEPSLCENIMTFVFVGRICSKESEIKAS